MNDTENTVGRRDIKYKKSTKKKRAPKNKIEIYHPRKIKPLHCEGHQKYTGNFIRMLRGLY